MKKTIDFVNRQATGGKVLFFLAAQLLVQGIFMFKLSPKFKEYSNGIEVLDLSPFYGVEYVKQLFGSTSEAGLHFYLYYFFTLDLIFPLMYAFSYGLIAAYLLKKLNLTEMTYQWLILLPFASAFFDYGENFGMAAMILSHPNFSEKIALFTTIFSSLKAGAAFAGGGVLIVLSFVLLGRKITRKNLT